LVMGLWSNLLVAGPALTNASGNQIGSDFTVFYAAAHEATRGHVQAVYDPTALRAVHADLVGGPVKDYRWSYPPTALLFFAPLAALPPVPALWVWLALTTGWLAWAIWYGVRWRPVALLVPVFPAVAHAMMTGPTGTLTAALLATLAATLYRAPLVAGICTAALTYKPHLAALVPLCLLLGGHWRVLAAAAATLCVLVGTTLALFGIEPWLLFLANVPHHFAIVAEERMAWTRMPTVFVTVRHATANPQLASLAQSVVTLVAITCCAFVWRRTAAPAPRWLAVATSLVLASPYALDYDEAALIIPFAWLARAHWREQRGAPLPLVLLWMIPVGFFPLSQVTGQQFGPLPLLALLAYAVSMATKGSFVPDGVPEVQKARPGGA
jgi:hypothetical protein